MDLTDSGIKTVIPVCLKGINEKFHKFGIGRSEILEKRYTMTVLPVNIFGWMQP